MDMKPVAAALALALAGCAGAPRSAIPVAEADCGQLEAGIEQAQRALREAEEKRQTAWKAVIPFAIAARHASGNAAAGEAGKRLEALRAEHARRGCGGVTS